MQTASRSLNPSSEAGLGLAFTANLLPERGQLALELADHAFLSRVPGVEPDLEPLNHLGEHVHRLDHIEIDVRACSQPVNLLERSSGERSTPVLHLAHRRSPRRNSRSASMRLR